MNLKDKTVVLTGVSSGIGYSLAKLLPNEKCSIALLSRREELIRNLANEIKFYGIKVNAYKCDVGKLEEVRETFKAIKRDFGKIDVAILNAGVSSRTDFKNYSAEIANDIFKVNTIGLVNCLEQLISDFVNNKDGVIVGVSSLAEVRGFPRSGFYNGSKAASTLILESLRIELKPYNIKVLIVKPGFVRTSMTDKNEFHMPFLMEAEKAAKIILDGIKKDKRIIQFPLPTVIGSKILKFMPDVLFDFLMSKKLPARKN